MTHSPIRTGIVPKVNYLVFDLDGTIVFDGKSILPEIKQELNRIKNKYTIIFASARPIRDMLPLLEDFTANDIIGANGAMYRQKQEIFLLETIRQTIVDRISEIITAYDLDYILDYEWDYSSRIRNPQNAILGKLDKARLASNIPFKKEKVSKIILFGVTKKLAELLSQLEGVNGLYHEDVEEFVITAQGIDKSFALKKLIQDNPYIAFGNDYNDSRLLEEAALGVQIDSFLPLKETARKHHIKKDQLLDLLKGL
ncbi:HAD family hydrolase [Streptococcus didelphis]|uniref:HAD family hydrolase n=1 Tax=Streptococcus didelphis TaxID=102886 RepID=A0ABY9LFX2_9STRE|nr:HAD-IIB family hydrolase [Streptococcus didelphis]WMB27801.1 HAD family hydrolase [Streptococcus didelphis]